MLRITIELLPGGCEARKRILATGTIANVGTGSLSQGNYFAEFKDAAGRPWKHCTVTGFPRKRLLAWDLLFRVLKTLVGQRNSL
jgi:hypothetical protein